jgi:hypothetical protein
MQMAGIRVLRHLGKKDVHGRDKPGMTVFVGESGIISGQRNRLCPTET